MFGLFREHFIIRESTNKFKLSPELSTLLSLIESLVKEKFSSSLKLYIFDSGSCNGCELELQLLFSPVYDLSSCGVEVTYNISKADILIVVGLITENLYVEFMDLIKELREPKKVILLGDCPINRAVFLKSYALRDKVVLENTFQIPSCPPEPKVILEALYESLKRY